jgi:hypothetical protein
LNRSRIGVNSRAAADVPMLIGARSTVNRLLVDSDLRQWQAVTDTWPRRRA